MKICSYNIPIAATCHINPTALQEKPIPVAAAYSDTKTTECFKMDQMDSPRLFLYFFLWSVCGMMYLMPRR